MCKNKFNSRFRIYKKIKKFYRNYINTTWKNNLFISFRFSNFKRGKYYLFDDEHAYLYIHRYDGEKGIIPKEVRNEIEVEPISILEVMELRTKLTEPDRSRYSFNWNKEKGI